jgi:hypothetical protein
MFARIRSLVGWNRHSTYLFAAFLLTCLLIVYIWWPLVQEYISYMDGRYPWYTYVDWLLLGIFTFMSLAIMTRADLKTDGLIVFVGVCGGLVIESWGTQTNLWFYYTAERPPLWIIPAWPIASLCIDRITRVANWSLNKAGLDEPRKVPLFPLLYWLTFGFFYLLMLWFVSPTLDKSFTLAALIICALIILTPTNYRTALLVFWSGAALGYFLELWGTTRQCWTYYTYATPPLFAVLAHGMAAVAFWRAGLVILSIVQHFQKDKPASQ